MIKILIVFLISFTTIPTFAQHKYKQNLRDIATITFPDLPKKEVSSSLDTIYSFNEADTITHSGAYYQAESFRVKKSWKDLFNEHFVDTLYNNEIKALISDEKGKLYYKASIDIDGIKGVEFCSTDNTRHETVYSYERIFYFNKTSIIYGVLSYDSLQKNDKNIRAFFDSFKITTSKKITQNDSFTFSAVIKYFIIIFTTVILMICLLIFILRRIKLKTIQ
jgi:hypothetical protein